MFTNWWYALSFPSFFIWPSLHGLLPFLVFQKIQIPCKTMFSSMPFLWGHCGVNSFHPGSLKQLSIKNREIENLSSVLQEQTNKSRFYNYARYCNSAYSFAEMSFSDLKCHKKKSPISLCPFSLALLPWPTTNEALRTIRSPVIIPRMVSRFLQRNYLYWWL